MALFPFAPVQGPHGVPLPPGPGTVIARIEDAVRETANDVVETMTGGHQASGTNTAMVTSPSGARATATFDENMVTVDEYNKGMEALAKRISKVSGQVAQIRTGMLAQNMTGQGWDGTISWDQYQAQQQGGGMQDWMPMMMMFLLTRTGNTGSAAAAIDPTTLGLMFMMSNGSPQNMMMPLMFVTLLKK